MKEFPVNDWAYMALVDDEDFDFLDRWLWTAMKGRYTTYAKRKGKDGSTILMHRVIAERMGLDLTLMVDHEDQNGLNNCRSNLRSANRYQNGANSKLQKSNRYGLVGICFDKRWGVWTARIKNKGKQEQIGTFKTAEEAALAYDRRAKEIHGPFAQLNFPGA